MCIDNENLYLGCADHLFLGGPGMEIDNSILEIVESVLGADVVRKDEAQKEVLALLGSWHSRGIMKPNDLNKGIIAKQV